MLLTGLMLVIHVASDAADGRPGKRMMAGDMPDDTAGNCTTDAAFGFSGAGDGKTSGSGNGERRVNSTHLNSLLGSSGLNVR